MTYVFLRMPANQNPGESFREKNDCQIYELTVKERWAGSSIFGAKIIAITEPDQAADIEVGKTDTRGQITFVEPKGTTRLYIEKAGHYRNYDFSCTDNFIIPGMLVKNKICEPTLRPFSGRASNEVEVVITRIAERKIPNFNGPDDTDLVYFAKIVEVNSGRKRPDSREIQIVELYSRPDEQREPIIKGNRYYFTGAPLKKGSTDWGGGLRLVPPGY